jgi:hypothetical protein
VRTWPDMPQRMRTLPRDPRGYPVPYLVLLDSDGRPQFAVNDSRRVEESWRKGLCSICGKRLLRTPRGQREQWFIGGSRCFLHEAGAFLDPPMHLECAEYALAVCPFLAARRYRSVAFEKRAERITVPDGMALVEHEHALPDLPERFGLGITLDVDRHTIGGGSPVYLPRDWLYVEWWRAGERISAPDTGEPPPI